MKTRTTWAAVWSVLSLFLMGGISLSSISCSTVPPHQSQEPSSADSAFSTILSKEPDTYIAGEYVIKPGDTVAKIAKRHGFTIDEFLALNPGLEPRRLKVGQHVTVKRVSLTVSLREATPKPFYDGSFGCYDPGGTVFRTSARIKGTRKYSDYEEEDIYRDVRVGMKAYRLTLPNGNYHARLKFCELQYASVGQRVFGVRVQGVTVTNRLDIVAAVGKNTAYQLCSPDVKVTNGVLVIEFDHITGEPCIAAMSIGGTVDGSEPEKMRTFYQHVNCGGKDFRGYYADFGLRDG